MACPLAGASRQLGRKARADAVLTRHRVLQATAGAYLLRDTAPGLAANVLAANTLCLFKPAWLVMPISTDGAADCVARAVGGALAKLSGQALVFDQRAGAGPTLGTQLGEDRGVLIFRALQATTFCCPRA